MSFMKKHQNDLIRNNSKFTDEILYSAKLKYLYDWDKIPPSLDDALKH
jgi:hypothetical protein